MNRKTFFIVCCIVILLLSFLVIPAKKQVRKDSVGLKKSHWLVLHRKSEKEFLYFGVAGDLNNSVLLKTFQVKAGNPTGSPTPLPQLLGRQYWLITKKESSVDNPATSPYFLTLDIPAPSEMPFGPTPYTECRDGESDEAIQCNWGIAGFFGLHGVNGNAALLSDEDGGSSGCVRHNDDDITYLYQLLDPQKEEIRYYINDI